MAFKRDFLNRLRALSDRELQEFPRHALPENYHKAAVLLPFWPSGPDSVEVVLTKRTDTLRSHPGQVSFPGGRLDPGDRSAIDAALRETHEELGIEPQQVTIMGRLDDAWSIAGLHVTPFVGWLEQRPQLTPNDYEVEEILIADVETLMQPESTCYHETVTRGVQRTTQAFRWEGGYVWGLTADLLMELFLWIRQQPSNRGKQRLSYMKLMERLSAT